MQTPEKYKHDTKIVHCVKCGKPMQVGIRTRKPKRCLECGIDALTEHNMQVHNRTGEGYAKWLAGMQNFIARGAPATHPPLTTDPPPSKE